jgi:hypothetical protein
VAVDVLDGHEVQRAEAGSCAAVETERMVFLLDQVGIPSGNELQGVVGARRPGAAEPDLAEPAAPEEANQVVAVEYLIRGEEGLVCLHAEIELLHFVTAGKVR